MGRFFVQLIHSNIHMDAVKCKTVFQLTLEDDINLKEDCPDISCIIMQDGNVVMEECKALADHVLLKGTLWVDILYGAEEEDELLAKSKGKLVFEESVYMEGVVPTDVVDVFWKIEDLSVGVINSRKISVRSLMTFTLQVDTLYDEIAATDIALSENENVEYRKQDIQIAKLAVCRKDVAKVHQELTLPSGYPNIYKLLYQCIRPMNITFKPRNDVLQMDGDLEVFLLYDSADEQENIRYYEQSIPLHMQIDCSGCKEGMMQDIKWCVISQEFEKKADFDGEERVLAIDVGLQLLMKLYEEDNLSIVSDVYGIQNEIVTVGKQGCFHKMLVHNEAIAKVDEMISMEKDPDIMQLLFMKGDVALEDYTVEAEGVRVEGIVDMKCLYITEDDKMPYMAKEESIPFSYLLAAKNLPKDCICNIDLSIDQMTGIVSDANALNVKISLNIKGMFLKQIPLTLLTDIKVSPMDTKRLSSLPGIAIYYVQPEDTLYQIGKKFYVPIDTIMQQNDLHAEELIEGQQLIIMR